MGLRSSELAQIVWAETKALGLGRADGTGDVNEARRMIAQLAASTNGDGFDRRESLPPTNDKTYGDTVAGLLAVCEDAQNAASPQSRLILWPAGESTDRPAMMPAPPSPWDKMPVAAITYKGRFQPVGDGAGGSFTDMFARGPVDGDTDNPVLVNALTGTGVPNGAAKRSAVAATSPARRWFRNPNWWIGLSGGALFFLAAFSLLWTASSFSQAYSLLNDRLIGASEAFSQTLTLPVCPDGAVGDQTKFCATAEDNLTGKTGDQLKAVQEHRNGKLAALLLNDGPECTAKLIKWASDQKPSLTGTAPETQNAPMSVADRQQEIQCLSLLGHAVSFASENLVVKADSKIGYLAQKVLWWLLSWHVPSSGVQTVSLGIPTSLMMLGVGLVLIGLGRGVEGTPLGALISPNGRYSLALAQVTCWTILVLTSAIAIAIFNGGLVSEMVRYFPKGEQGLTEPVVVANGFFPIIPAGIWAVLGISFGSTALSVLIKSLKGYDAPGSLASISDARSTSVGGISFFRMPVAGGDPAHRASLADWFLGEDADNKDKIDISRVQMVLVTAGLLITYGNAIFATIRNLTPMEILATIRNVDVLVSVLPPVGATMAIMLAASHATYLVAKAADPPSHA